MQVFRYLYQTVFKFNIVRQFGFALLILSFSRFIWFLSNRFWLPNLPASDYFKAFFTGVYFDLPVLAYFFSPLWIWLLVFPAGHLRFKHINRLIFSVCALVCILLNGIDTAYSRVTTKRSGFELYHMLSDEGNKIAPYIKDYFLAILGILVFIFLIYKFVPCNGSSLYIYRSNKKWQTLIILPFYLGIWLLCARGGMQLKPLRSIDAGRFTEPELMSLVVSTPLQIMTTFGQKPFPDLKFMDEGEAEKLIGLQAKKNDSNPVNKKNVVLILVESLGRDYTGFLNNKPYTPFLDSLSKKSINFRFCFANGLKSIEMVPSVFCGLPALGEEHYINSIYSTNKVSNLFAVFNKSGYSTSFYHGAANGTMGFQAFLKETGLTQYNGLDEYPEKNRDFDGDWGIFDEPYLQYFETELDKMKQPFFSTVFTLSSHHPYKIPDNFKTNLPVGPLPIHRSIAYTDYAIRRFFEKASKAPWFKNTIFVITGDHTSYGTDEYFYSQTGHFEIPLLIYSDSLAPQTIDKTVSQCDIGPTILDLLHNTSPWFGLGRSAFDSTYQGYSVHYENGLYYLLNYPYILGMDEKGQVKDFCIRLRNESIAKKLEQNNPRYAEMKRYLEAYIQVYSQKIRTNHWFY